MPKTDHRKDLTPTRVASLKPAAKGTRYQVMDAQVPGFGVRVTDTGNRTFILRTRYPGSDTPSRREIGKCDDMPLADARTKAREWRALVAKGVDPAEEAERVRVANLAQRRITFRSTIDDFIKLKLPAERSGRIIEQAIRRELLPQWGELALADVTAELVSSLIQAKGRASKTAARNLFALIKRFFRWAIGQRNYGITNSPCADLRATDLLGEMGRTKVRLLADDELFALWRASGRLPYPFGPIYRLLCLTALRLNEGADASRMEINFRDRNWTIPAERMKGKDHGKKQARPHIVPLTDELYALFGSLPRLNEGDFLFSTTNGESPAWITSKIKKRLDGRMFRTLKAMAKLRGEDPNKVVLHHFVNHDIRRTVRSHLSRLKIAEETREAVLAHARPGIKGIYDLYDYRDEKLEALEMWGTRLGEIVQMTLNQLKTPLAPKREAA